MKARMLIAATCLASTFSLAVAYATIHGTSTTSLPADYENLSALDKQKLLWDGRILPSAYTAELPKLKRVNPLKLAVASFRQKLGRFNDEAGEGYEKTLHAHGVVAKVRFEAEQTEYTGLFKGVDHGLIRLSLTGDPETMTYAPGLALKFLIDGQASQNVSALYKLSGQGENHDFFAHELSNVIPMEFDPSSVFSSTLFSRVTRYPTKISVTAFAERDQSGYAEEKPTAPVQLYFVPNPENHFSTEKHDFRDDLLGLPSGTLLYEVYAVDERGMDLFKIDQDRRARAKRIGRIVTTSEFIASQYGDDKLFFKHNRFD